MKQVITEAKRKKIAKALHDTGTISKIKYIAVGSGGVDENNEVLSPSETATALKHELLRKEYTSSQKISDTCYEYTLVIEANELVGEYIRRFICYSGYVLRRLWVMEKRIGGLFFSVNNDTGAVGFSFAVVYIPEYKEIQAVMQIGTLELAVGYEF